jgi:hypothetical protein
MSQVVIGIALRIHVRPVLVLVQEVLHPRDRRQRRRQLFQRQYRRHFWSAAAAVLHHAEDGEIVACLVALAAALVLVVDDVLADVAVDVLVRKVGTTTPAKNVNKCKISTL